jgi:hypothetical protein
MGSFQHNMSRTVSITITDLYSIMYVPPI